MDDARFAIDPARAPALQVLGVPLAVPDGTREAALLVDGEVVDEVRSPFIASWRLVPGAHWLSAQTTDGAVSNTVGCTSEGRERTSFPLARKRRTALSHTRR